MEFIIVAALGVAAGVACLLWLPHGRKVGGIEPRCAACGYIVRGLPRPLCPECAADLAKPGAIITTGRLPPGRLARSIAWTIFCVVAVLMPVGILWQSFVMPALPLVHDGSQSVTLFSPESKSYRSIALHVRTHALVYRYQPDPLPSELKIELTRSDGTSRALAVDVATLHFHDTSAPGSAIESGAIEWDALVWWLKSVGVQGGADQLKGEMSHAMTLVHQFVSGPVKEYSTGTEFKGVASVGNNFTLQSLPWVGSAPLLVAAIIWCIGMIWIIRKPSKAGGDSHMVS